MGWWMEHGLSSMDAVLNTLWVSVPPLVRWVVLVGLWELLSEPGQALWPLIAEALGFPSTCSCLISGVLSPHLGPSYLRDVLNVELDVDGEEVGGELTGEGLAVGPVVPASEPPGDSPCAVTLS